MYGLAAIQQANGWAMAGAGACIVLSGLAVLSFLISMLPRFTSLIEKNPKPAPAPPVAKPKVVKPAPETLPDDLETVAGIYKVLTEEIGEVFSLVDLHRKTKEMQLPHPHLSINRLREAGILVPKGDGNFSWQPSSE
ncbi:OadG family transporter subunit [uncultured Desulfosarcina sp.]|uniref:OadG family transporter subunit n=1 Tax=uncultured Desulfosarcina sp. TaxID=218289 RepID=UPI0029C85371|nr:OadG family transporter subunit [uncultured Desulfosarcina sp.]